MASASLTMASNTNTPTTPSRELLPELKVRLAFNILSTPIQISPMFLCFCSTSQKLWGPAQVAQWCACQTHDRVVVSLRLA